MEINKSIYSLFSKDSLSLYADSLGYENLSENVLELLSDDLNYQIHSLIQKSCDYMRMCKRKKLTIEDINKSLEVSNIKPLYGHGSQEITPQYHEIKNGELFVVSDDLLDLNSVIEERANLHIQPNPTPNISSCWLNVSPDRILKRSQLPPNSNETVPSFDLKSNCSNYIQFLKDSMDENNKEAFHEICDDIKSNPHICLILLNLLVFLQTEMDGCGGRLVRGAMILAVVDSIIANQHLFLDIQPHLKLLISIPRKCMATEWRGGAVMEENVDEYVVIHRASYLAFNILRLWATDWNGLLKDFENDLNFNLLSETTSLSVLYSILLSHFHLGYNAVRIFTFPRMNWILERLEAILVVNSKETYHLQLQANQLRGLLLIIFQVFLRYNLRTKSLDKSIICPLVYATLYETYSDSLASSLPIVRSRKSMEGGGAGVERWVGGEPTMKIKSCVGLESTGLKLTILTKPRSNIPRPKVQPTKVKVKLKLQEVFDVVQVRSRRDALFVLKLRGRQHLCTFTERRKAQILQRNMAQQHAAVSRYRTYVAKLQHKPNNYKMNKINRILPFDFSDLLL